MSNEKLQGPPLGQGQMGAPGHWINCERTQVEMHLTLVLLHYQQLVLILNFQSELHLDPPLTPNKGRIPSVTG